MKIYNITKWIKPDMVVYKDRDSKKAIFSLDADFDHAPVYETRVSLNMHTGTHMDFPKHVSKDGFTSKDFDPSTFLGDVKVFDFSDLKDGISQTDLIGKDIKAGDIVFFKTRNSFEDFFNYEFIYLKADAANYLKTLKVKAVGIDALGIERDQAGHPTHHALLDHGIYIIEGLDLKIVQEGIYELIALPLLIDDVEGLPMTVLLKTKSI